MVAIQHYAYLEFIDNVSSKFYEMEHRVDDKGVCSFHSRYGRIGARGVIKPAVIGPDAVAEYGKLLRQKISKGYALVCSTPPLNSNIDGQRFDALAQPAGNTPADTKTVCQTVRAEIDEQMTKDVLAERVRSAMFG